MRHHFALVFFKRLQKCTTVERQADECVENLIERHSHATGNLLGVDSHVGISHLGKGGVPNPRIRVGGIPEGAVHVEYDAVEKDHFVEEGVNVMPICSTLRRVSTRMMCLTLTNALSPMTTWSATRTDV